MTTETTIVRHPNGEDRHEVTATSVQIPDLWHTAMYLKDECGRDNTDIRFHMAEQVLECWSLCHDLLAHIQGGSNDNQSS